MKKINIFLKKYQLSFKNEFTIIHRRENTMALFQPVCGQLTLPELSRFIFIISGTFRNL